MPKCGAKNELDNRQKCVHWRTFSVNEEKKWVWLFLDALSDSERLGPHQERASEAER